MNVPGDFVKDREKGIHCDKTHARFHKPAGQQAALTETVEPVTFANGLGFRRQIEGSSP
jgi:hypothetical protein